jgi:rubrerythrin
MALPVMKTPTYEMTIPSTKQKIKYRPFLVKEEKALMIAHQSEDQTTMLDTLKGVIDSCTFGNVDVNKLAMFDIEYIFVQLRAKSVGEISELIFSCKQCGDPKAKMKVDIDLTKLEVTFNPENTLDIPLFDDVGVKMKYPGIHTVNRLKGMSDNEVDSIFEVIIGCIDSIYDADSVYTSAEQSKEDLTEFINNLTQEQFGKLQKFFETMPKLEKKVEFDCPICGFHHNQTIQGLEGFF